MYKQICTKNYNQELELVLKKVYLVKNIFSLKNINLTHNENLPEY